MDLTDSSDDDAPEVEMDDEDLEELLKLEEKLKRNSKSYQDHVHYITLLEKHKLKSRLPAARQHMHSLYCLPEELWLNWLNDELEAVQDTEDILSVLDLCQEAVNDYLSVSLWKLFLDITKDFDPEMQSSSEEGKEKFRQLCEKALGAAGLHFLEGQQIWDVYRGWEAELSSGSPGDKIQEERVRKLFQRNLSVPLPKLQDLMEQYKHWEAEHNQDIPPHVVKASEKVQQAAELRQMYENTVAPGLPADSDLLGAYMAYIKLEADAGDPARVQCLYERAVCMFPTVPDLWLKYLHHLEAHAVLLDVRCSVAQRATRNCSRSGRLWALYLSVLELRGVDNQEHERVYAKALEGGLKTPGDLLEVILSRGAYLRRRTEPAEPEPLRTFLAAASQLVAERAPDSPACSLRLSSFWAHCEAHVLGSVEAARQVWEAVVKGQLGRQSEAWQQYISLERSLRHPDAVRNLYSRVLALKLEVADRAVLCRQWLEFEREEGSAEQQRVAWMEAGMLLADPMLQGGKTGAAAGRKAATGQVVAGSLEKVAKCKAQQQAVRPDQLEGKVDDAAHKRQRGLEYPDENAITKRPKVMDTPTSHEAVPLMIRGIQHDLREADKEMQDAAAGDQNTTAHSGAIGSKAKAHGTHNTKGGKVPPKVIYTDHQTVYVRNLGSEVTEAGLRELFKECVGIREVRIPKDQAGVPKGFAYIELQSDEAVAAAEQLHGMEYQGQRLFVKKSDPPKPAGGFHKGKGRGTAFKGGPGGQHGEHHDQYGGPGQGQGHGEAAPNRPPGQPGRNFPIVPTTRVLTGAPKPHLQLSAAVPFMPRSVQQPAKGAAAPTPAQQGAQQPAAPAVKSNADFRKMFFGEKGAS